MKRGYRIIDTDTHVGPTADVLYEYGSDAFEEVRQRVLRILTEEGGKNFRASDIVALDEPGGTRFLFFLDKNRELLVGNENFSYTLNRATVK